MEKIFSERNIINSSISPFSKYCTGYSGKGSYITALTMGIGRFKETFSHPGSKRLDSIVAYDRAEIKDAYIGQINMVTVSSFCGPQGLIWGCDIAKEESEDPPSFLSAEDLKEFKGIEIKSGVNLRMAARALFGTVNEKHFPFLPGSYVPCAGKFEHRTGPTNLYGAVAIGIPDNRNKSACLLMEDVGEIASTEDVVKKRILMNMMRSVLEVGKNQRITYKKVFVDLVHEEIPADEMGCVLIAMPYFLIAKSAVTENLIDQKLSDWIKITKENNLE